MTIEQVNAELRKFAQNKLSSVNIDSKPVATNPATGELAGKPKQVSLVRPTRKTDKNIVTIKQRGLWR